MGIEKHSKQISREYPEILKKAKSINKVIAKGLIKLVALFYSIADKKGRKFSQELLTRIFQQVASVSLPVVYQLNELIKCEGDVFENFKKYNRTMFISIERKGIWKSSEFIETKNLLEFKINSFLIAELFKTMGCSELCSLGCSHNLAGYPLILHAVQCEFRCNCIHSKPGDCCHFQFYRKGTAPDTAHLNQ